MFFQTENGGRVIGESHVAKSATNLISRDKKRVLSHAQEVQAIVCSSLYPSNFINQCAYAHVKVFERSNLLRLLAKQIGEYSDT